MRDYQGNNRNHASFYAYGLPVQGSEVKDPDPYLYGSKEFYSLKGVNLYDFHARTYAADIARFMQPDPLATENHGISPYIYCNSDPINKVDPTGMLPFDKSVAHKSISSKYGQRKDPFTGELKGHTGIDLSTHGTGHDVHVIADGIIKKIGWDVKWKNGNLRGYGRYVVVAHADGYESLYAHLEKDGVTVSVGDVVSENDVIAKSGDTGGSTGPHLHIEIGKGNILEKENKIDPATIPDLQLQLHPDTKVYFGGELPTVVVTSEIKGSQVILLPISLNVNIDYLELILY